jgi:iron(III) transport system permease protein
MTVTLPLLKPGLANAFLVGFIESIADFGNPIVVGGQFSVLSTEIFFAIVGAQYDQGRAASLAWILTLFALAVFAIQRGLLGKQNYTTVSVAKAMPALRMPLPDKVRKLIVRRGVALDGLYGDRLPVCVCGWLCADLGPGLHDHAGALSKPRSDLQWGEFGHGAGQAQHGTRSFTTIKLAAASRPQ